MSQLTIQFLVSTMMVSVCVIIHGFGLFGLARALRTENAVSYNFV